MIKQLKALTLALFLVTALYLPAFAVGSTTQALTECGANGYVWTVSFVGDASTGAVPNTTLPGGGIKGMYLYQIVTNPGAAPYAPTAAWGVTIASKDGVVDILGSQCLTRSAAASEVCYPSTFYLVDAPLVLSISGNSVASATGTVKVFFVK